jgi:hypothetical protein
MGIPISASPIRTRVVLLLQRAGGQMDIHLLF